MDRNLWSLIEKLETEIRLLDTKPNSWNGNIKMDLLNKITDIKLYISDPVVTENNFDISLELNNLHEFTLIKNLNLSKMDFYTLEVPTGMFTKKVQLIQFKLKRSK